jgi:hypothetical protein
MRKNVCSQSIQIKLITVRWVLKEGTFKRKRCSSTAETNEQNIKALPNEDAQSQAFVVGKSRSVLSKV